MLTSVLNRYDIELLLVIYKREVLPSKCIPILVLKNV